MVEAQRYRTLARSADAEIEVKKSRFLAVARRVADEDAARAVVAEQRKAHHDARHHCWAFVAGPTADLFRSSDDGEPSGTAGAPILEAITRRDLSDVVVVVTRWFGGTLLGTGGLARAYGQSASDALDAAGTRDRQRLRILQVRADHAEAGKVDNAARHSGAVVRDTQYSNVVRFEIGVPEDLVEALTVQLLGSFGSVEIDVTGSDWVDADEAT